MANKIKGFIGETLIYGVANVFSRVFAMLLIPLYASYLGKVDYSNLIMLQSVFSILTFLLGLNSGVFYYYYEYEKEKYRRMVFSSWFYYEVIVAILLILGLIVLADPLSGLFVIDDNQAELQMAISLLGFQFIPYLINNTNINLFRIDRNPKRVMMITLLEAFFTLAIVGLGLHYFSFGIVEIIIAQFSARALVALLHIKTVTFYLSKVYYSFLLLKKLFAFSWPFFIIYMFQWMIISIDKFIGAGVLSDQTEVALLALAMQLSLPITVLADMIRMAIGPFVMSIRKDDDADKSYQSIFNLSVFVSLGVMVALIASTPWLVPLIADKSYIRVIEVIPLIALASVLSLIANQFAISFSLIKKNVYILYATLIAGTCGFLVNYLFMRSGGFIVSGYSQIASYLLMATFLFITGKRIANNKLNLSVGFQLISIATAFILFVYYNLTDVYAGSKFELIFGGGITIILLSLIYLNSINFKIKTKSK
jgi:O-antigen/teichoic acid export membrane protein